MDAERAACRRQEEERAACRRQEEERAACRRQEEKEEEEEVLKSQWDMLLHYGADLPDWVPNWFWHFKTSYDKLHAASKARLKNPDSSQATGYLRLCLYAGRLLLRAMQSSGAGQDKIAFETSIVLGRSRELLRLGLFGDNVLPRPVDSSFLTDDKLEDLEAALLSTGSDVFEFSAECPIVQSEVPRFSKAHLLRDKSVRLHLAWCNSTEAVEDLCRGVMGDHVRTTD